MKWRILGATVLLALAALAAQSLAAPRLRVPESTPAAASRSAIWLQSEQSPAESREHTYEVVNFLIMAAVLAYLLRRPLKDFFADRDDAIRQGLEEGRKALAAAEARMSEVETKLSNLGKEIAAFKVESERAMGAERERLKQAAESEAARLMGFAQTQIESATRAAKGELKRYAAGQAVELAEAMIRQRLDDPARRGLVARFVRDLKNPEVQN
ncbi:MAG TPA: ATP synthase F0 subunit B [Terriglobia bacterium]|nr:ATP synthase F0 subunit B [Terriglobia bacterium]